jgi:hypothetical protein
MSRLHDIRGSLPLKKMTPNDVLMYHGGDLARVSASLSGTEDTKSKAYKSARTTFTRHRAGQRGISKKSQERLNASAPTASGDLLIKITGSITINGYTRDRTIDVHMTQKEASDFAANPSFQALADAYNNGSPGLELEFGDDVSYTISEE